jgi:hypothetical protein
VPRTQPDIVGRGGGEIAISLTIQADSDNDGMPDWWETRFGLNPQDTSDGLADGLNHYEANRVDGLRVGTGTR